MPLTEHAPKTLRFLFAACAAATRSPLSATQRAAILESLRDPDWLPDAVALPETTAVVTAWYDELTRGPRIDVLIRAEEPIFVLRGQDRLAPNLVRDWADAAEAAGFCPPEKLAAARAVAVAMEQWHTRKFPD